MAANQIWKPGDRIGEHEILRLLAEGGHGQIYVARHSDGSLRAIKTLHEKFLDVPELRRRFDDEVLLLSAIESVHVVRVFEYGMWEGHPWFSMEYLDGIPLRRAMQESGGRLGIERAFRLARQMARGVHAAHQLKAVHRDLKPDNILIMPGDVSKIVDFGIAKIRGWAAQTTAPGGGFCTPLYAAPEQIDGSGRRADERTDVYSLGVILWEMLTGKSPFVDEDGQPQAMEVTLSLKLTQPIRRLDLVIDGFPSYLADVVEQATALDPSARFPNAYALAEAIKPGLKRWIQESRPETLPPQPESMRKLVDQVRTDEPPRAQGASTEGAPSSPGVTSGWAQTVPMAKTHVPSWPQPRAVEPSSAAASAAAQVEAHALAGRSPLVPPALAAASGTAPAVTSLKAAPPSRAPGKERRVFATGALLGVLVSGAMMLGLLRLRPPVEPDVPAPVPPRAGAAEPAPGTAMPPAAPAVSGPPAAPEVVQPRTAAPVPAKPTTTAPAPGSAPRVPPSAGARPPAPGPKKPTYPRPEMVF